MLQRRISTHARTAVPTRQQEGRAFTDLALKQHIVVKPGTPIQPIINASLAGQSIYLLPGEHPVYEPLVLRGDGAALFGQRGATVLRKLRAFTEPMLSIPADTGGNLTERCTIAGLTLTCKYGTGRQIELKGRDHVLSDVICAAEVGVQMAAGIWCEAGFTLLHNCYVFTDALVRSEAEIWIPDGTQKCRVCSSCAPAAGAVISYRGIDLHVNDGANIPAATVR